jgi:hypothetical protein
VGWSLKLHRPRPVHRRYRGLPRYHFGEIRLSCLNFYSKFLLHRTRYEWGRPLYSAYFSKFYGHILFVFAMVSLLLSAMQVELAAEALVSGPEQ